MPLPIEGRGDRDDTGDRTRDAVAQARGLRLLALQIGYDDRFDNRYSDYDAGGRLTQQTTIDARGGTRSMVTFNIYDAAGNLKKYAAIHRCKASTYTTDYYARDHYETHTITVAGDAGHGQTPFAHVPSIQRSRTCERQLSMGSDLKSMVTLFVAMFGIPPISRTQRVGANMSREVANGTSEVHTRIQT